MFSGLTQDLANAPLALIELIIQSFRSCKYNMETKYSILKLYASETSL